MGKKFRRPNIHRILFSSKGITISSENLTEILDRWIAISKQKPLFALLTDDGEKITLEGTEHITDADLL